MNKPAIRNVGVFTFIVIMSGWIGVAIDSFLISQPEGNSPWYGICKPVFKKKYKSKIEPAFEAKRY